MTADLGEYIIMEKPSPGNINYGKKTLIVEKTDPNAPFFVDYFPERLRIETALFYFRINSVAFSVIFGTNYLKA